MTKLAVIRIRGKVGIDPPIGKTLDLLKLKANNNCTVLNDTPEFKGMLIEAQNHISWGEISEEVFIKLVKERGKISDLELKKLKFKNKEELAKALYTDKLKMSEALKLPFKLSPPRKGFERGGMRKSFKEGGVLGYRGEKINELLERMI